MIMVRTRVILPRTYTEVNMSEHTQDRNMREFC
jgi:hypothetical protein